MASSDQDRISPHRKVPIRALNASSYPQGVLEPRTWPASQYSLSEKLVECIDACDQAAVLPRHLIELLAEYATSSLDVSWDLVSPCNEGDPPELVRTDRLLSKTSGRNTHCVLMHPALAPGVLWKISVRLAADHHVGPYIGVSQNPEGLRPSQNIGFTGDAVCMNWWSTSCILLLAGGRLDMHESGGHFPLAGFDLTLLVDLSRPSTGKGVFLVAVAGRPHGLHMFDWHGGPVNIASSLLRIGERVQVTQVETLTFVGPWWMTSSADPSWRAPGVDSASNDSD